jgi:MtaA/CmuA family methyltransferase
MNGRQRILDMVRGSSTDRLPFMPITMMFASDLAGGRYLDYATDHRIQVAAQLKIARDFDLDHVSVISDPCCEAADCGAEVIFYDNEPPAPTEEKALLREKSAFATLSLPNPNLGLRMANRVAAVNGLSTAVGDDRLVEGWIEGPCAEAADLRGINRLMLDFYDDPKFVHELIDFVVELEIAFGRAQVEAGAKLIGIGDAAASLIGPSLYAEFIRTAEQRLVAAMHEAGAIVRLHICGNTRAILPFTGQLGCEIIDVDSMVSMADARQLTGPDQVLCGNLDPVRSIRFGEPDTIRVALATCQEEAGVRYIVGGGCEIPRGTPLENFRAMVDFAHASG